MDALSALRLQIEWGADEALDDAPIDRTRAPAPRMAISETEAPAAAPPRPTPRAAPPAPAARPRPVARAQALAAAATTLDELRAALAGFTDCPLAATATNLVFADGNPTAGLVLVGEAPDGDEDLAGIPFAGPTGRLLNSMLASIGLDRTHLLITNLVPWRPPGGRPPTDQEVQMCLPFLRRHLALLAPRIVVTFGALTTRALTGNEAGIRKLRGRWLALDLEGAGAVKLLPMLHPAYLRRTPAAKREAWGDLLVLKKERVLF
jgi:uracil-DNA glycosylase family 4